MEKVVLDGDLTLSTVLDGETTITTRIDGGAIVNVVNDGDAELSAAYDGEGDALYVIKNINDPYEGEYTITPLLAPQSFATSDKVMTSNLTVLAIPYMEVSNLSGGYTATIGG